MTTNRLGRALAATVGAVAVLNTLSALSLPVRERRPELTLVIAWLLLLSLHAMLYWFGDRMRAGRGLRFYVTAQGAAVFAIAVTDAPVPVALGMLMAATAEVVVLAGERWGTIRITLGAILLFVVASALTSDLYRATTAGLMLAITGAIAHAAGALVRRRDPVVAPEPRSELGVSGNGAAAEVVALDAANLTPRETEVLRELVSGARSGDIAAKLGITERTVKSHLANIYQKLGVESRTAAVATAVQRRLV
jgi:DNA-binding CsgD family transcriptional regulator